jgi:hypothetical protein
MKVLTFLMLVVGARRTIAQNLTGKCLHFRPPPKHQKEPSMQSTNSHSALLETCGNSGYINFNNTNVFDLAPCTHLNYICSDANTNKSSLGSWQLYNTSTTNSSIYCISFAWDITADFEDGNLTGALVIPGVEIASSADFSGGGPKDEIISDFIDPSSYLNLTDLELPDLTTIAEGLYVESADKIKTLSFPKLETVGTNMVLNLSGPNPPAINLSFPSLSFVNFGIDISGNIDA